MPVTSGPASSCTPRSCHQTARPAANGNREHLLFVSHTLQAPRGKAGKMFVYKLFAKSPLLPDPANGDYGRELRSSPGGLQPQGLPPTQGAPAQLTVLPTTPGPSFSRLALPAGDPPQESWRSPGPLASRPAVTGSSISLGAAGVHARGAKDAPGKRAFPRRVLSLGQLWVLTF